MAGTTAFEPGCAEAAVAIPCGNGGVPVASNPADLADPTKYECIAAEPWKLE
jgi:hypothetical protein